MSTPRKQVILGAHLGGAGPHPLWPDLAAGRQASFSTVRRLARTAERGKFDFIFLGEGLTLRDRPGQGAGQDRTGGPGTLPVLAAIAAVTGHLGLIGTLSATGGEPQELARQLASLDHLPGGRAGVSGQFSIPRSPHGHPVILQTGVSPPGRDFAAAHADVIVSPGRQRGEARAFCQDIRARAARHGRPAGAVKLLSPASVMLGDSRAEALERYRQITHARVSGTTAQMLLETVWNRDLSGYDPDGPLPGIDPDPDAPPVTEGRPGPDQDARQTVRQYRALANAHHYTLRELAIHLLGRTVVIGTPRQVADRIDSCVQNDGPDGFIIGAQLTPAGLDEFVDRVVPLLQERGSLRANYTGTTLRDNLGIPAASPTASATVA